jgi:hypothetical protein
MKKLITYKIIFLGLLFSFASNAQNETDVLAIIGSDKITVEEFQNRFDFMPHLNYSTSNIDSVKKEFLYSLVAEKLWALEADELQINTIESVKLSLKTLQKLFVKDELYKQEVESKINITGEEISIGLSRVTRILEMNIVASTDSQNIWNLYNSLLISDHFDSLVAKSKLPNKESEIKLGSLQDERIEDIVYSLKMNEFTKPILSNSNWFIFKLISDYRDETIDLTKEHAKNIVVKTLSDRKSQKIGREYLDRIFKGRTITADRKVLDLFYENLKSVILERVNKTESDTSFSVQLLQTDLLKCLSHIDEDNLNKAFTVVDNDTLTIKDYVFYLIYQKIEFKSLKDNDAKIILNMAVRQFIETAVLYNEGLKVGLDNLRSVKSDLQIWKNYYLSEVLMNSYADSIEITDEEINNFINGNQITSNSLKVNIREILIDNIEDAEKILNELNEGKEFESLVSAYNQREWTKQSNGEWGFFNPQDAGEIGRIAADLKIDQIYGPIKVNEGYSIFKLIDKRNQIAIPNTVMDKDSLKFIRVKIALSKMDKLINDKTVSLAGKYQLNINEQLLKNTEVSELNTFTYRFIGFGGKIAAFPITIPMYEWYEQYKQKKEIP